MGSLPAPAAATATTMPVLKLHYGPVPFWRAEVSRLALHLGNVPFEDCKNAFTEEFKKSGKAPFGSVPVLEVEMTEGGTVSSKIIAQTGAIARYCGKQGGFYPRDDDFAAAKIDEIIDTATDITMAVGKTFGMQGEEKKAARKTLAEITLPKFTTGLERIMQENGATGFFVGGKMTIADLAMWRLWGWLTGGVVDGLPADLLAPTPLLLANFKAMDNEPRIKEWMAKNYPKK